MKLFFPTLYFFISKKLHYRSNQLIYIYICDFFLHSLFLQSMFSYLLSLFDQVIFLTFISICSNSKRVTMCMVKKPYTSKAKICISLFYFLVSHLLLLGLLLFFFIIYFYLINITYKYNKLLCIQWLLSYWFLNYY